MTGTRDPVIAATLYEATHYGGTAVTVPPDEGDEGGGAVVYSLARLGLSGLGSLRAPTVPADPEDPFRQELHWVTTVTVWESKPDPGVTGEGERGRTWQEYGADTADLGSWAAKAAYVRVGKQTAEDQADASLHPPGATPHPIVIVIVE
ncbi:hypothetical protein [Streptomyces sp. NPDC048349]|uniref:hypothetical protein n=1 Tax=Streptomyces sp. NPDC048349 TaxID=3155486 RepID=UPI00342BDFEE